MWIINYTCLHARDEKNITATEETLNLRTNIKFHTKIHLRIDVIQFHQSFNIPVLYIQYLNENVISNYISMLCVVTITDSLCFGCSTLHDKLE